MNPCLNLNLFEVKKDYFYLKHRHKILPTPNINDPGMLEAELKYCFIRQAQIKDFSFI